MKFFAVALLLTIAASAQETQPVEISETTYVAEPVVISLSPSSTCYFHTRSVNCWSDPGVERLIGQQLFEIVRLEVDGIPYIYASIKPVGKNGFVKAGKYSAQRIYRKRRGMGTETHLVFPTSNAKTMEFRMVGAPGRSGEP